MHETPKIKPKQPNATRALPAALGAAAVVAIVATDLPSVAIQPLQAPVEYSVKVPAEQLSAEEAQANFERIEEALSTVQVDSRKNVVLSRETETALTAAAAVADQLPARTMERLQFLIRQRLPGRTGEQMADLFEEYYRYHQIERREIASATDSYDITTEIKTLKQKMALRERYFGRERADRLFGDKHRLTLYIFALRRLEAARALSNSAKEAKRRELHARFEKRDLQFLLRSVE